MADVKNAPKPKSENGHGQARELAQPAPMMQIKVGGTPFSFVRRFAEEMDHLLEDFGMESGVHLPSMLTRGRELLRRETGLVPAEWSPKLDVMERDGKFLVRADLPGMKKDDVKVEICDNLLTIQGERKQEKQEEHEGYKYSECSYGSFYRSIPVPEGADGSKVTAEFRDGVLEVAMPMPTPQEKKAQRVEIREGK